jgi:hypothetical protein
MYNKMKETTDAKVGKMETIKKETHRMNGRLRVKEVNRSERKRTRGQEKKKKKGNNLLAESRQRNCCLFDRHFSSGKRHFIHSEFYCLVYSLVILSVTDLTQCVANFRR